jgi:hypothetical protein
MMIPVAQRGGGNGTDLDEEWPDDEPERDDERASVGVEYVNVGFGRTQRAGRRP